MVAEKNIKYYYASVNLRCRMDKQLRIGILDYSSVMKPALPELGLGRKENCDQVLRAAIRKEGHLPVIYRVNMCQMFFHGRKAEILYKNKEIKNCDVLIPRVSVNSAVDLEVSIIKQFQMLGVPVVNKYLAVASSKNNLRALQILTQKRIPVPRTIVVRRFEYLDEAVKKVGGYPVVLRAPYVNDGREIVIIESRRSLYSAVEMIWSQSQIGIVLIHEYVAQPNGGVFVIVVGEKVVSSIKCPALGENFAVDVIKMGKRGRNVISAKVTDGEESIAKRAAKAIGLNVCGVNILRGVNGPVIMGIDSNPILDGVSEVTGVDVASAVVKYAILLVNKQRKYE